ncbi:hypothetical protein [Ponticaulis profundi]|uniref:Uncharacterized protein n=1 Tax=Ponticaulis profundi TaxID=2665222 RepID=A0ABW1S8E1_9PROT
MALTVIFPEKPTREDFEAERKWGFTGSYERWLTLKLPIHLQFQKETTQEQFDELSKQVESWGGPIFIHGDFETDQCADCSRESKYLCDYPVGDDKTCDRMMCKSHSHHIGGDVHYCEFHFYEWTKYTAKTSIKAARPSNDN